MFRAGCRVGAVGRVATAAVFSTALHTAHRTLSSTTPLHRKPMSPEESEARQRKRQDFNKQTYHTLNDYLAQLPRKLRSALLWAPVGFMLLFLGRQQRDYYLDPQEPFFHIVLWGRTRQVGAMLQQAPVEVLQEEVVEAVEDATPTPPPASAAPAATDSAAVSSSSRDGTGEGEGTPAAADPARAESTSAGTTTAAAATALAARAQSAKQLVQGTPPPTAKDGTCTHNVRKRGIPFVTNTFYQITATGHKRAVLRDSGRPAAPTTASTSPAASAAAGAGSPTSTEDAIPWYRLPWYTRWRARAKARQAKRRAERVQHVIDASPSPPIAPFTNRTVVLTVESKEDVPKVVESANALAADTGNGATQWTRPGINVWGTTQLFAIRDPVTGRVTGYSVSPPRTGSVWRR